MEALLGLLALLSVAASIGSIVCLIMVLIKLFQDKGVGWGIFGIFCGIYTFIWGWQNVSRHNLNPVMLIWTGCIVLSVLVRIIVMVTSGSASS